MDKAETKAYLKANHYCLCVNDMKFCPDCRKNNKRMAKRARRRLDAMVVLVDSYAQF